MVDSPCAGDGWQNFLGSNKVHSSALDSTDSMERKEDLVENLMSSTGCRTSEERKFGEKSGLEMNHMKGE